MYPELGTDPVSYDDCISEEFFAAERKAVFERDVAVRRPRGAAAAAGLVLHP